MASLPKSDPQIAIQIGWKQHSEVGMYGVFMVFGALIAGIGTLLLMQFESSNQMWAGVWMLVLGGLTASITFLLYLRDDDGSGKKDHELQERIEALEEMKKHFGKKRKEIAEQRKLKKQEGLSRVEGNKVITVVRKGDEFIEEERNKKLYE